MVADLLLSTSLAANLHANLLYTSRALVSVKSSFFLHGEKIPIDQTNKIYKIFIIGTINELVFQF